VALKHESSILSIPPATDSTAGFYFLTFAPGAIDWMPIPQLHILDSLNISFLSQAFLIYHPVKDYSELYE
jgi:hypothetical protein